MHHALVSDSTYPLTIIYNNIVLSCAMFKARPIILIMNDAVIPKNMSQN